MRKNYVICSKIWSQKISNVLAQHFPFISDYRNPLLAEAMKIIGMVNKFNRGIAKVKAVLEENGNPKPIFDINRITEFRVILKPALPPNANDGTINANDGTINANDGTINANDGTINANDGTINANDGKNSPSANEAKVYEYIIKTPGCKRTNIQYATGLSLRTLSRLLKKLMNEGKIVYRGSNKTGGWYIRT